MTDPHVETAVQARRREILTAALALADEKGLPALSMRTVAARVGVTPMALYPYVGSKDALLDGLVDLLLAQLLPTTRVRGDWSVRLRAVAMGVREVARRHPASFPLLLSRPSVTPDAVRLVDAIYSTLLEAGVPAQHVPRVERLISTFALGYAVSEANGRFDVSRLTRGRVAPDHTPGHRRLAEVFAQPADWDAEYAADLDDLEHMVRTRYLAE